MKMIEQAPPAINHQEVMHQAARDVMNMGDHKDTHKVHLDTHDAQVEHEVSFARHRFPGTTVDFDVSGVDGDAPFAAAGIRTEKQNTYYEIPGGDYGTTPRVQITRKGEDGEKRITDRPVTQLTYKALGRLVRYHADRI